VNLNRCIAFGIVVSLVMACLLLPLSTPAGGNGEPIEAARWNQRMNMRVSESDSQGGRRVRLSAHLLARVAPRPATFVAIDPVGKRAAQGFLPGPTLVPQLSPAWFNSAYL